MMSEGRILRWAFVLAMAVAMAGCGSHKSASTRSERLHKPVATNAKQTTQLLEEARKWLGTPYRYGGESRRGTDCSGLTMQLYLQVYGLKLPRSSAEQQRFALPIEHTDLQPGDLVFFAPSRGRAISHVGLYVGNGKMIHASSRGVIESDLSERYYQRTYHSAGRVLAADNSRKAADNSRKIIDLDDKITQSIDSIYVADPEIFD